MAEAEQFSLRWNNFHSNLSEGFHSLLEEVDLVDVTLAADGQYLQAHKIVLSVCSPYFKQLFKANPCKHPIVILKDVCHKDLQALLQFMYQGEVNVRQEELAPFLKTAEMLQIKGLTGSDSTSNVAADHVSDTSVQPNSPAPRTVRNVTKSETSSASEMTSPPFKRQRTSSPVVSRPISPTTTLPLVTPLSSASTSQTLTASSSETPSADFVPIQNPKLEPLEYDAEADDIKESPAELVQLLHGSESSQPPSELPSDKMKNEVCKIITSRKGKEQIVINGYIMVKNKSRYNSFYWECKYRKLSSVGEDLSVTERRCRARCRARACTEYSNGVHILRKMTAHNHAPGSIPGYATPFRTNEYQSPELPAQIVQAFSLEMSDFLDM